MSFNGVQIFVLFIAYGMIWILKSYTQMIKPLGVPVPSSAKNFSALGTTRMPLGLLKLLGNWDWLEKQVEPLGILLWDH